MPLAYGAAGKAGGSGAGSGGRRPLRREASTPPTRQPQSETGGEGDEVQFVQPPNVATVKAGGSGAGSGGRSPQNALRASSRQPNRATGRQLRSTPTPLAERVRSLERVALPECPVCGTVVAVPDNGCDLRCQCGVAFCGFCNENVG